MENKIKLSIGAVITLALALSGGYYVSLDDDAYHCESRDLVMICEKLSGGTGTRCYYDSTYKTCKEGWEKIELGQEVWDEEPKQEVYPSTIPSTEGTKWLCSPDGCKILK